MTKIESIEDEFDEPFNDVVRGFAIMGYSKRAVAGILEINLSYFRQILSARDLHKHFKKQKDMREECRGGGNKGYWKGKKRPFKPRKYSDEYLLELVSKWPNSHDFMGAAPISYSTVTRRFKMPWQKIVELAGQYLVSQLMYPIVPGLDQERTGQGGLNNHA